MPGSDHIEPALENCSFVMGKCNWLSLIQYHHNYWCPALSCNLRRLTFEYHISNRGTYTRYFGLTPHERASLDDLDLSKLPIKGLTQLDCGGIGADIDTAWNEEQTPRAVRTAVGAVIEAASSIIRGQLTNAFAIIRPPGKRSSSQWPSIILHQFKSYC